MNVFLGEPERNIANIVNHAATVNAELIVFPECANSGYGFQSHEEAMKYAETVPGPLTDKLASIARKQIKHIAVGLLERNCSTLRNTAVLFDPDGQIHAYRKTHLPFLGVDRFVIPGNELCVFNTKIGRIGILICYEWRFPETARCLALRGAEVIIGLSAWPQGAAVIPKLLIAARAAENRLWVVSSNRVGTEDKAIYIGKSAIVDPTGNTVAELGGEERIAIAEIDPATSKIKRIVRDPGRYEIDLFNDRRPALYRPVVQEKTHA
jgi:predicted amidohydrolase